MRAATTSASTIRLTSNGAAAGSTSTINLPNSAAFELGCKPIVRNTSSGNALSPEAPRPRRWRSAAAERPAPTGYSTALAADTTNGGPAVSITAPGSGYHTLAHCLTTELQ
ncbi:hypothetical protein [Telmatospirillum sp.]|uniref:hypothetical protein n=1 Tax=Telmatospirillum sp. TaxID=2079197 RepID=UPI0028480F5A|nr:hypothetical protein [Telmatospirillum sp.]MDR3438725.1 hypothetical protein [Telmatospirillum sp.]